MTEGIEAMAGKKKKDIEIFGGDSDRRCECESGTSDQEKLIRYRCAQSLFNISMDLKQTERMASGVCLVIAKGLIADLELPEGGGSMHTPQTIHDSNVPAEVEAMAEKIREEINSTEAPHSFLSKFDDEMVSDHG